MKKISFLATAIIICLSVIAVSVIYVPKIMGYKTYAIETGSMEPTIKTGSLVFVKKYQNFEDYAVGDIVTFSNSEGTKNFTHRIVGINMSSQSFDTKGDANEEEDIEPTEAIFATGKVEIVIPYVGYAVTFLNNTTAKVAVAVIYIAWAAIEIEVFTAERKKRNE